MRDSKVRKILEDEQCFEIVQKKLKQDSMDDFSLIKYEVVPFDEVLGYLGQYYTLKVTVGCSKSPFTEKIINFFTKIPPPMASPQYDFMQEQGTFRKEVALYTIVFPEFLSDMDTRCFPECFLGLENDVIVLEDMVHSGFKMTDKTVPFDFDHCQAVIKTLARFHSKSLIFEERYKKNLNDTFGHCMQETLWPVKGDRSKGLLDAAVKGNLSLFDLLEKLDNQSRKKFKEKFVELSAVHAENLLPSKKFKNVLCHGDLWANNILFKYDKDKRPVECCLVDFQLARYNPPAHDILCFLQFTTTRDSREKHLKDLLKIYFDTMALILREAGFNIDNVLPWNDFIDSVEDLRTTSMTHGTLNIPIMLLESNVASKYFAEEPHLLESVLYCDRTPLIKKQFEDVPRYRDRLSDAMYELYDRLLD